MDKYGILKDIHTNKILDKLNEYVNTPSGNAIAEEQLRISLENTIKFETQNIFDVGVTMGSKKVISDRTLRNNITKFKTVKKIKEELRREIYNKILSELKITDKLILERLEKKYIQSYGN